MTSILPRGSPGREPATVRVAMWSARHRWLVVILWFAATIGLFGASQATGGIDAGDANGDPNERQLESSQAYDVFNAGGTNDPYEQFIVVVNGGAAATSDPAFQAAVGDLVTSLRGSQVAIDGTATPTFDQIPNPFEVSPEAGLVSADGTTVRIAPASLAMTNGFRCSSNRCSRSSTRRGLPIRR